MATERLIVELSANTSKLDSRVDVSGKKLDGLDRTVKKTDSSLGSMSRNAKGAALSIAAIGTAVAASGLISFSDKLQMAENQLKSVVSTTEEYNVVSEALVRIATETRQSITDLTSVYARFKRAGDEAGFTIQETLDLTESLTKAFKIEGNTTAEVNSVLLQLTQSFRSGLIAGEEFRALSEGSTIALRALASEAGVTTGELKKMASEGLITPELLLKGLAGAEDKINTQFAALEPTFGEAGTALGNAFNAAFQASGVDGLFGSIKSGVVNVSNEFQRLFSGKEVLSEDQLQAKISDLSEEIMILKSDDSPFNFGIQLKLAEKNLYFYTERLRELQGVQSTALEITVGGGIEDPRIQRELDFAEAVKEIQSTTAVTLEERFKQEVAIHKEALDQKLINEKEYQNSVNDSAKKYVKSKELEVKVDKKSGSDKLIQQRAYTQAAMSVGQLLFEDNKLTNAGLIVADTATSVMATAKMGFPQAIPYIGMAIGTGLAQLANLKSASKGGGSISGGSTAAAAPVQQQESFAPETSEVGLDFRSEDQQSTNMITFNTATGDPFIDALSGMLNENMRQGRA